MKQKLWYVGMGIVVCFATLSCGITELYPAGDDDGNGVWNGPSVAPAPSLQAVTYVSAFDYPDGYDWRSDPERGEVRCSLVVFREGLPILKVPVGYDYCVGPDPDMHRIIDGHLYTDYSTGGETIIKRDGKLLLIYPTAEMICDFKVRGDEIHTLGHSRSGKGFSYRVNGETRLERTVGYTFERIIFEDTTTVVAFAEPIVSSSGTIERYYVMRGGKVSQVALREDVKKVWDVAVYNGEVCYLASLTGVVAPVLVTSQGVVTLSMPTTHSVVSCRMNILQQGVCVEGVLSSGKTVQSVLWGVNRQYTMFPKGMIFSAVCQGEDGLHCTINSATGVGAGLIYRGGESLNIPPGYACMSRYAMDFVSGMLSVGLSSPDGGKPALWVDGKLKELDINGYISCVASVTQ